MQLQVLMLQKSQDVERRQDAIIEFIEFLGPPLVLLLNTVALLNVEPPDPNNPGEFLGPLGLVAKVVDQKVEEATEPLAKTHDVSKTDAELIRIKIKQLKSIVDNN